MEPFRKLWERLRGHPSLVRMNAEHCTLEKPVWTEADFEQMCWHDVHVHAVAFRPDLFELWLDIDYIFSWVHPPGAEYLGFWIAPATLAFENVYDLRFQIEFEFEWEGEVISLQGIERTDPRIARNDFKKQTDWHWLLGCQNESKIAFRSVGFSQFTRRPPLFLSSQRLTLEQRGAVSFERDYTP